MTLPFSTDIVPPHQYNGSPCQYGVCTECGEVRRSPCWCFTCETTNFIKNFDKWTSGNSFLDGIIRITQSHATESMAYFEWIPFENFVLVEQIASGSFSAIYIGYWLEGPRWIWDEESENWLRNGPTKCALKKIGNSSEISNAYLNNISNYYKCIQSGSVADFFGITCDSEGCYMFVMRFYENGNLYQYLDDAMGYLCWRDIVDMLWGIANGLERIHDHGLYHGNLHGGNLLVENEPESIDTRIADVGLHGSWVTAICDDPDPSQISEQFDAAEEKKFLDLENKQFTKPEIHPLAIYNSRPIHFSAT
ncbi:3356_t:CDS:2 [Dentiscutata heterogama]|uniref:3356_t:CDS:1 n=1 Tax=Dentiscutata heterogama TaxID=1316150 RepID=A0ACA9LAH2_9GLOM|nr:3356_t:CDS:2 [Dentiscutata heterogama]